jgi:Saxitoxin biosynthesis operon protein SxtJ
MMATVSKSELRKFGLTVGGAFAVFGTISWWRGHEIAPLVLWTLGALLILPGAVAPALLQPVQRGWMRFAAALGHFNTRVILGLFFYVVLAPFGFILRLFKDPLNLRFDDDSASNWVRRKPQPVDPASYERQF